MKFVYVLVGTEDNFMVEQALISIYTLRKHNPEAFVTILMDKETSFLIKKYNSKITDHADEIKVQELPEGLLPIQKSRFLKTISRKLVRGKMLYIDCDTIINGSLNDLEKINADVASVSSRHGFYDQDEDCKIEVNHYMNRKYLSATGLNLEKDLNLHKYFNGGVILSNDSPVALSFFDTWHKLWWNQSSEHNYHKDQAPMWHANLIHGNIIHELNGKYNCQLLYPKECMPYLWDARILHYFSSVNTLSHLPIKNKKFLEEVRIKGIVENSETIIKNFRSDYMKGVEMVTDISKEILNSPLSKLAKFLYSAQPRMYKFLNRICGYILRRFIYRSAES